MQQVLRHDWPRDPREAARLQNELRGLVDASNQVKAVRTIAAVDAEFKAGRCRAAAVVLSYPGLETLDVAVAEQPLTFPYVPGLLSFREAPTIVAAAERLKIEPDLLLVDGQGIAHPRRFGIAAHLGVLFGVPTIGCAKSRLVGRHDPVGPHPGDWTGLFDGAELIGAVVRTKASANPLYVSIGHKIDLPAAISYVLSSCAGYRLPEPARRAHLAAGGLLAFPSPA